jgi:hypothetical protein
LASGVVAVIDLEFAQETLGAAITRPREVITQEMKAGGLEKSRGGIGSGVER